MIDFRCRGCLQIVTVQDDQAGQTIPCPLCGTAVTVPAGRPVPPVAYVQTDPDAKRVVQYARPRPAESVGLATAALVLGICGFAPCAGPFSALIAIVLGIVVLVKRRPGKKRAIAGVVCGTVSLLMMLGLLLSILWPALQTRRAVTARSVAASQMHFVGLGFHMYTTQMDQPPPDLQSLVETGILTAEELADASGFVYAPPASDAMDNADVVIACDLKSNHDGEGRVVLFADGHTEWLYESDFQAALKNPENAAFAKVFGQTEAQTEAQAEGP